MNLKKATLIFAVIELILFFIGLPLYFYHYRVARSAWIMGTIQYWNETIYPYRAIALELFNWMMTTFYSFILFIITKVLIKESNNSVFDATNNFILTQKTRTFRT